MRRLHLPIMREPSASAPCTTRGLIVALCTGLATLAIGACDQAGQRSGSVDLVMATQAASAARQQCHVFMHEDADEFTNCIDAILARTTTSADLGRRAQLHQKLGISYFGWVGANNSARVALPGAAAAAQRYLSTFRPLQRALGLEDAALCQVLEGDCATRVAQTVEQEQALVAPGSIRN